MKLKKYIIISVILFVGFVVGVAKTPLSVDCENKAEELITNLNNEDYVSASKDFDTKMKTAFKETQMKEVWVGLTNQVGTLVNITDIKSTAKGDFLEIIVVCRFEKAILDAKIYCNGEGQLSGFFIDQHKEDYQYIKPDYVISDNFIEKDIIIGDGIDLKGKLTIPKGNGQFPCVILVHGSGPNDMDETYGPNKIFKDIAWGLASRGIAVIRYNKRTYSNRYVGDDVMNMTLKEEVIDDVVSAFDYGVNHQNINPDRIFVLGHSLGGMCVPRIAEQIYDAAGFISFAGTLRSFKDILPEQYNYIFGLDGEYSEEEEKSLRQLNRQIEFTFSSTLDENFPADSLALGIPPKYWMDYNKYDWVEAAELMEQPILIMQGGRDYQITEKNDFAYWKLILKDKYNAEYKVYPKLNHYFIAGEGEPNPDEYMSPGHVKENVIIDIVTWVMSH